MAKEKINFYYELKEEHDIELDEAYIEIRIKTTSKEKADKYLKEKVTNHSSFNYYDCDYA